MICAHGTEIPSSSIPLRQPTAALRGLSGNELNEHRRQRPDQLQVASQVYYLLTKRADVLFSYVFGRRNSDRRSQFDDHKLTGAGKVMSGRR